MEYNGDYIKLSDSTKNSVKKLIKDIYSYIESQYNQEILNPIHYGDVILFIAEAYPMLKDKERGEEIGYNICKAIRQDLEYYGVVENDIGMIGSLGYTCFAVSEYSKKTGNLNKFSNSLNKLLLNFMVDRAEMFRGQDLTMSKYDVISGLSGSLYYILDFSWKGDEIEKIEKVISYLVDLTKFHDYKGYPVIKYHITRENQFRDDEKESYPNGNFNFGISHGMMGLLVALSKAFNRGYRVVGLEEAIIALTNLYEKFKVYKDNIPLWPAQLPFEQYVLEKCEEEHCHLASSWCYGNISIARGLQKVAKNMGWIEKEKRYKNDLIKIINQPNENYNLYSPALCHGYSSVLAIRTSAYVDNKDFRYINNIEENINIIFKRYEENNKYIKENKQILDDKDNYIDGYFEDLSLLNGSLGIGLALLGVLLEEVNYGRLLLID